MTPDPHVSQNQRNDDEQEPEQRIAARGPDAGLVHLPVGCIDAEAFAGKPRGQKRAAGPLQIPRDLGGEKPLVQQEKTHFHAGGPHQPEQLFDHRIDRVALQNSHRGQGEAMAFLAHVSRRVNMKMRRAALRFAAADFPGSLCDCPSKEISVRSIATNWPRLKKH